MTLFRASVFVALLLSVTGWGAQPVSAQRDADSAVLTGRVEQAATDAALPGANVSLQDPTSGTRRYGTATDSTGAFALRGVDPGTYRLVVRYVGYAPHTERVTLSVGTTERMAVALRRRALSGDEVVVRTDRKSVV